MHVEYWHKQSDKPLYKELLWDKPENKHHAGKLLIIGGNLHSFVAPATAFTASEQAGIGTAKVLLPQALQKIVGNVIENGEFAPSNNSGSFASDALAEWLNYADWADGVLLAGDFGRNSETAVVLEQFLSKFSGQVSITQEGLDYFMINPKNLLTRSNTTIVTSFAQLQKLGMVAHFNNAFTFDMPVANMVNNLHDLTNLYPINIVLLHDDIFYTARGGEVCTTKTSKSNQMWQVKTATHVSVWTLQNPSKIFESLATAVYELIN